MPVCQVFNRHFLYNYKEVKKMITLQNIQERIAEIIKQSGLTQKSIAEKLNVKQQTVQQYVSGRSMPALDTLANLCKLLDVDANYILCQD